MGLDTINSLEGLITEPPAETTPIQEVLAEQFELKSVQIPITNEKGEIVGTREGYQFPEWEPEDNSMAPQTANRLSRFFGNLAREFGENPDDALRNFFTALKEATSKRK
jgi:hypothetical protein